MHWSFTLLLASLGSVVIGGFIMAAKDIVKKKRSK